MKGYKRRELESSYMHLKMASQRPDTRSPSSNGTNELIANLDHDLLDVRVRAVKCLLRKLECGIVSTDSLKNRVDLLDRCRRWLSKVQEGHATTAGNNGIGNNELQLDGSELEGVEFVIQLFCNIAKHKEFRDLLRKDNIESLLSKFLPYLVGDYYKCQLGTLLNSIVVGQYELSYEGSPSEWYDNKTCPLSSSRQLEMFSSSHHTSRLSYGEDAGGGGGRSTSFRDGNESSRNTPAPETQLSKNATIPLGNEQGWIKNIPFFVPSVYMSGTDKRVIHSTLDSLSGSNDSLVIMTVTFIRDTLVMDYPSEFFIQEPAMILALAQVTVSRWTDRKIPYTAIQTLLRISRFLRFRIAQLNCSDHYEIPHLDPAKANSMYYDYDGMSYSSRMTSKSGPSASTPTDSLVDNFAQLFKSFARALLYTSYDLHIWTVFDSFAFTLLKCFTTFPVDAKVLSMSLNGILMELCHIWERKNDFHTVVGLCVVSSSILSALNFHNESFIVSKDVRNMLRSISCNEAIRKGWPEVFEHFLQFSEMFDPTMGSLSESQTDASPSEGDSSENHPKQRILKLFYAIQNASSHEEVLDSVDSIRDVLLPMVFNSRLGNDALTRILHDLPWRDTFYRFLCVEPRTDGDEELLSRVLDLFTFTLQNITNATVFKWITPLCCKKSSATLKLLGNTAAQNEMRYGGTAITDLLRSLFDFYEVVLTHGTTLMSEDTTLELFQVYTIALHSLEQASYSYFALLTAVTKSLAHISERKNVQVKLRDNPVLPLALIHRMTDAIMVMEANGSLMDGYKNSASLYYLSVCICHMLIPVLQKDNFKNFNNDWIERCGRIFHILTMSPDVRVKTQAFQICQILTSSSHTKGVFAEASFKNSTDSLLEIAYSAFVDPKNNANAKSRAGGAVLNVLNIDDKKLRLQLVKMLQGEFPVLVDICRLSSHPLWECKLSVVLKNGKPEERSAEINKGADGIPFITPKVLTVLCKILISYLQPINSDSMNAREREIALQGITSSGICQMMFRIILNHPLKSETIGRVWLECCTSISTVLEVLISLSQLDETVSIILIGEKRCLSAMLSLLDLEIPDASNDVLREKMHVALSALCGNILTLGTILSCDAGSNFEDLERVAWSHQAILFTKLTDWLSVSASSVSRQCAIGFTHAFLSVLSIRTEAGGKEADGDNSISSHPFLCRNWKDDKTYGQALCENLINIMKNSVDTEERLSSIKSLTALFTLSKSSVSYAVENNDLIQFCVKKLQSFGNKFFEAKGLSGRKSCNTLHGEVLCHMKLLSGLFYISSEAKKVARTSNFPDVLHKIFGWWSNHNDLTLLHAYIETLLNFTEKHPEGALSLIMTSHIVGVLPRRVPTQQSIFIEILGILEKELATIEGNSPNLKTIEIIFEFLKNLCFVQECRNILLKSPALLFVRKIHVLETKKWGHKQNAAKANYLDFLVHASVHSDVQICMAKVPECLEILVQLAETDNPPSCSILALKVLRNLTFNPSNRGRLLTENMFVPLLSHKLMSSNDLEEIEHACVSLWALVVNFEKGRLTAKKSYCGEALSKALERVRKLEQTSSEKDVTELISLLEIVQKLLENSKVGGELTGGGSTSMNRYFRSSTSRSSNETLSS